MFGRATKAAAQRLAAAGQTNTSLFQMASGRVNGIAAAKLCSEMANPNRRDSAAKKVTSAARAIIANQVSLPVGCLRVQRALFWLSPYETDLPTVFDDYLTATQGLPIGSERLEWDRNALREKDQVLDRVNERFRGRVIDACWALIDRFSGNNSTSAP